MAWARKKSGPTRLVVASSAVALAPFSQNSTSPRSRGSGQAQLGQSNPVAWFSARSTRSPRPSPASRRT
jgi:hypothetical protein